MRVAFEKALYEVMHRRADVVAVVADSATGEYEKIKEEFPKRYIDFGIAESNMVAASAGIASTGKIPVLYTINAFLVYRAYEFIRNDICMQNRKVIMVGSGAGVIYNNLGPTHHTTEDIAVLRVLPNLTVLSPASVKEVPKVLDAALEIDGPVFIRLGKSYEVEVYEGDSRFAFGKAIELRPGGDATIIGTGSILADALDAVKILEKKGISVRVLNMATLKPLDGQSVLRAAKETRCILTLEEHSTTGGLGSAVSEVLCRNGIGIAFQSMGFEDCFCTDYGYHQELKKMYGLDGSHVAETLETLLRRR
jgi:transketolase